ncbi:MAG: hypothetical protein AB8G23_18345 [Myxococcota bacterium]
MSYSIEPLIEAAACEGLLADVNAFIDQAYTPENVRARRSYVYEYAIAAEAFAFAVHCPGSEASAHLPGFQLDELPASLAETTRVACEKMGVTEGRVLFNATRYPEHCEALAPHYDGELFEFDVHPVQGSTIYRAIRPRRVGVLTLRNDSVGCGTTLHDADEKVTETHASAGEFLMFDNTVYQHGVPATGVAHEAAPKGPDPRWIRVAIGWRAFEQDCFYWNDGEPLRPIDMGEAVSLQEEFLAEGWPLQIDAALERASFPFPKRYV